MVIYDANEKVYQVPESVLPRPASGDGSRENSALKFSYKEEPFSFTVTKGDEVLFDTSASNLIFQSQYLNLRTWLPKDPYLYGLGEHSDSLRLPTTNYTRTLWNRDAYSAPKGTNLYGSHPVYYDHRGDKGTHGVFFLNSNGMDVKIDKTRDGKQYLEYNTVGGVFDFYFFAGSTPKDASAQYAEIVGLPAMQSYWTFGVCLPTLQSSVQWKLTYTSSKTANTATGISTRRPRWFRTTAGLASPWRPCGTTSTTWTSEEFLLMTPRGIP